MRLDQLPAEILVKIVGYLPLKNVVRISRVNRYFYDISATSISKIKSIEYLKMFNPKAYWQIQPSEDSLYDFFRLCSRNLKKIDLDVAPIRLLKTFAQFSYPNYVEIHVKQKDGPGLFGDVVRKCPNLKVIRWFKKFDYDTDLKGTIYPKDVFSRKLEKLEIGYGNTNVFLHLTGHCPNLKSLTIREVRLEIEAKYFDDFFATYSNLQALDLGFEAYFPLTILHHFWQLESMRELILDGRVWHDQVLEKISASFPKLETLEMSKIEATNRGVGSLASLRLLKILKLRFTYSVPDLDDGFRQISRWCDRLDEITVNVIMTPNTVRSFRYCPLIRTGIR